MQSPTRSLIGLAVLIAVSACKAFAPTLVDEGIVTVDIEKTWPVHVSHATVYRDSKLTVVSGVARSSDLSLFGIIRGHIDIDLIVPSGETVEKRDVRLIHKTRSRSRGRRASFAARFSVDPPKGTVVRIVYHEGTHDSQQS